MIYNITVTETLSRVISVEADSHEAAVNMVIDDYRNENIVLDASDFLNVTIGGEEF